MEMNNMIQTYSNEEKFNFTPSINRHNDDLNFGDSYFMDFDYVSSEQDFYLYRWKTIRLVVKNISGLYIKPNRDGTLVTDECGCPHIEYPSGTKWRVILNTVGDGYYYNLGIWTTEEQAKDQLNAVTNEMASRLANH
jgi:hypothetical protein